MAEYLTNTTDLTKVASAIREKGGTSDPLVYPDGFVTAIQAIQAGGSAPGTPGDITFYDYDGTIVTSWTLSELATKTALPDYPSHNGLICQGWNWLLADLKTTNRKMNVGAMYITDDGKTRIYIRLEEGRTSPMLGCCPNGTVTVDWGDGTTPDTLTGTSATTVKWTLTHNYAAPGDYIITLTVNGTVGFYSSTSSDQYSGLLRYSSGADGRNLVYLNSIKRIEIGDGVTSIEIYAFYGCSALAFITIPDSVTSIGNGAFYDCSALASITIPDSVTSIKSYAFYGCSALASITIPDSVTSIGNGAFYDCSALASITIPDSVTSIGTNVFYDCKGIAFYDFTLHTTVPTLASTNAFTGIPADCQIRVPAALVDAWKAATNWSTYADYIVGV